MGKKSCTTLNGLQTEIMRRANIALEQDVAPYIKSKLKEEINRDVYSSYNPKVYNRREGNDGLVDDNNIVDEVRKQKRTLYVYEEASIDGPRLNAPNWINKPDSLALLIENGAYNPWNNWHYKWMNERPFMSDTQEYINDHSGVIIDLLKNRIENDDSQ